MRLTEAQRQQLSDIARRENRTLSGEIRHALERHIAAATGPAQEAAAA